jgi:hypothetical protein
LPTVYFAEFLIGIIALAQSRHRSPASLAVLVAAFACVLLDPFFLSGAAVWPNMLVAFRNTSSSTPPWNAPITAPIRVTMLTVGWRTAMSIIGLAACYFERSREAD